jgi:hypothetical protein
MRTNDARYEVKEGRLFVNSEAVPLRKGVVYVALARAGWNGREGPVTRELFDKILEADRRISIFALGRELENSAA